MSPQLPSIVLSLSVCFLAVVVSSPNPVEGPQSCYALNRNPYLLFGPSTSYDVARRKEGVTKPEGCSAIQLWMVSRHGTRYPDPQDYAYFSKLDLLKEEVLTNHKANQRGSLCQADLDNLEQFKLDLPKDLAGQLTLSGKQELFDLGRHIRGVMPEIFTNSIYSEDKFRFLHTPLERTKESAAYFYKGLFGLDFDSQDLPKLEENRNLIYTYPECTVWKGHAKVIKDLRQSKEGEQLKNMQQSVSKRLGFEKPLKIGQIKNVYDACRLNAAFNTGKTSPWCAAFNEDELKLLEYQVDVFFYHKSGPGYDMNKKLACPAVKDLMETFSQSVADADRAQRVGSFYFTHHLMVDILNTGLQMTRDTTALTYDNYEAQAGRQYRTTRIMPFTGHILAVLYQCPSNKKKIIFYQNEHAVEYPGCSEKGECDLDTIKNKFNSFVNDPGCTDRSWCTPKEGLTNTVDSESLDSTMSTDEGRNSREWVGGLAVATSLLLAMVLYVAKNVL